MGDIHPYLSSVLLLLFIVLDGVLYKFQSAILNVNEASLVKFSEESETAQKKKSLVLRYV